MGNKHVALIVWKENTCAKSCGKITWEKSRGKNHVGKTRGKYCNGKIFKARMFAGGRYLSRVLPAGALWLQASQIQHNIIRIIILALNGQVAEYRFNIDRYIRLIWRATWPRIRLIFFKNIYYIIKAQLKNKATQFGWVNYQHELWIY